MRTLIIVALALVGFSTAAVAQDPVVGVAEPLQADQIKIDGARTVSSNHLTLPPICLV